MLMLRDNTETKYMKQWVRRVLFSAPPSTSGQAKFPPIMRHPYLAASLLSRAWTYVDCCSIYSDQTKTGDSRRIGCFGFWARLPQRHRTRHSPCFCWTCFCGSTYSSLMLYRYTPTRKFRPLHHTSPIVGYGFLRPLLSNDACRIWIVASCYPSSVTFFDYDRIVV